jgi:hypothetical protein
MNKKTLATLALCVIAIGSIIESATAKGWKRNAKTTPAPVLTETEAADLLFMREEEKLARDVYISMYEEYGLRVFNNISKAEQRHMDALLALLNTYGLEDPILGFGEFANPELQELYDTLIAQGLESKLDALMVGALIEEVDMKDIVDAIERTNKTDIQSTYGNLLRGSQYHLRAFVRNIENFSGETYEAQWLTQEEVDAFLAR